MKKLIFLILFSALFLGISTEIKSANLGNLEFGDSEIKSSNIGNLELGKRYLKLSNTYRIAGNYIKAEDILSTAQNYIFMTNSRYWKAIVYEYYANIKYDMGELQTALLYYYKAYKIYLLNINSYDGKDDAIFNLIKERFPNTWQRYINLEFHNHKIKLKIKLDHRNEKINDIMLAKRYITLANTYINLFQTTFDNEDLAKAESFLNFADKILEHSNSKYWKAVVYEGLGFVQYLLANVNEAKSQLYSAYNIYRNIIMHLDGSDDAVYELLNNLWPGTGLTNPYINEQKSFFKLEKAFEKVQKGEPAH